MGMQLLLEDYVALLRVGVLPHERAAPQRVQVNITAQLKHPPRTDDLPATYNYTNFMVEIDALAKTHFDLLESYAMQLAKNLLVDDKLQSVEISLVKLDIFENGRVGVRYRLSK